MIGYRFLSAAGALPPPQGLYEMVVARNGIFLRAERPGLRVILPFSHGQMGAIPGLQAFMPGAQGLSPMGMPALNELFQQAAGQSVSIDPAVLR